MALAALARRIFGSTSDRHVKRYQGKVTAVEILDGKEPNPFDSDPKQAKAKWQAALPPVPPTPREGGWQRHQLFQDAVNSDRIERRANL